MIDDIVTALPAQIDVDVGQVLSFRMQESFKTEPVCQWIDLGDS